MKRLFLNCLIAAVTVCLLVASVITPVYAADSGVIIMSRQMKTGEDITITMTYRTDGVLKQISGTLTYDKELFKYKSGGSGVSADGITINDNINDTEKMKTYSVVFTAVAPGTGAFSFTLEGLKTDGTKDQVRQGSTVRITGAPVEVDNAVSDPPVDALSVTYDGEDYTVVNDTALIPALPGFSPSVTKYSGTDVNTLTDGNERYTVFCLALKNGEGTKWFYLNDEEALEPLEYLIFNEKVYIVENPLEENPVNEFDIPEGDWKAGKYTLPSIGVTVDCYESTKSIMSDFYILLCYCDGVSQYYRYDSKTGILQRDPGFVTVKTKSSVASAEPTPSLMSRMANLSHEAKMLIFLSVLETALVIALIVLLVLKKRVRIEPSGIIDE